MSLEEGTQVEEGHAMNPSIQAQQVEDKAKSKGWKPLTEFEGDPADWVDSKEFVAREPLYNKINDLKRHITKQSEKFDQEMKTISSEFSKMSENAYKKALAELKADRALAVRDADIDAVDALDEQIVNIEKERAVATVRKQQDTQSVLEPPEMTEWKSKNTWFEKNSEMTEEARALGSGYLVQHQGKKTVSEMLEFIDGRMKKLYPETLGGKKVVTEAAVEGDGGQSRPSPTRSKGKLLASDLNDDEKQVMKTLLKRGVLKDIAAKNKRSEQEEYLAQLADAKAR